MKIHIIITVSLLLLLTSCKQKEQPVVKSNQPKNVILLISDGTGLSQVSSAFYYKDTAPNYGRFENIGLINTSSSREDITDSAASATAFACGVKTYNGAIGVSNDSIDVRNLVEVVSEKNIKTGIIATSSVTHATPAGFYAHALNRSEAEKIAFELTQSEVDFFAGGGIKYFTKRKDGKNLIQELVDKKFSIDTTSLKSFSQIQNEEKVGYLLAEKAMPKMLDGRGDFLSNSTELAIQFLNKDNSGFFMMVEGSQVDWGGHDNDGEYLVSELIDFDDAVGRALDFAEKDSNTLVIVTSDHETGGFTLAAKKKQKEDGSEYNHYSEIGMEFATTSHSATLVPVFAYGPGSEKFKGIYQNNEIFNKILEVTNWDSKE